MLLLLLCLIILALTVAVAVAVAVVSVISVIGVAMFVPVVDAATILGVAIAGMGVTPSETWHYGTGNGANGGGNGRHGEVTGLSFRLILISIMIGMWVVVVWEKGIAVTPSLLSSHFAINGEIGSQNDHDDRDQSHRGSQIDDPAKGIPPFAGQALVVPDTAGGIRRTPAAGATGGIVGLEKDPRRP